MILKKEIEQYRTSDELKSFVEGVRKRVESDPDELQQARIGKGWYKVFVDEVMPLSQFAHLLYPSETLFLPVLGNQGYDVEVFDAQKNPIGRIEIAKPHDGQVEAENSRLVNDRGFGQIEVFDLGGQLDPLIPWVAKTANKKSLKDYGDCTLVIVAAINPPFDEEVSILNQRAIEVVGELGKITFLAKRAYLAVPALNKCFKIKG